MIKFFNKTLTKKLGGKMTPKQIKEVKKVIEETDNPENWRRTVESNNHNPIDVITTHIFPNGPSHISEIAAYTVCRAMLI
jgi:hypothetical protein